MFINSNRIWCLWQVFLSHNYSESSAYWKQSGSNFNKANLKTSLRQTDRYSPSSELSKYLHKPEHSFFCINPTIQTMSYTQDIYTEDKKVEGNITFNFKYCWNRIYHGLKLLLFSTHRKQYSPSVLFNGTKWHVL